jgi:hypothetical protein
MCQILIYSNQRKAELYLDKKYLRELKNILADYSLQAKLIELAKLSDAKMMM